MTWASRLFRPVAFALLAGGVIALFLVQAVSYWNYVNDDAYITYRYSRNLSDGIGPFYNPGEHVEGYSNPSLMLLLALLMKVGGAEVAPSAAKMIGIVSGAISVLLCILLVRRLLGPRLSEPSITILSLGAGGIAAISPGFALNCVSGLETGLFALCVTAALYLTVLEVVRDGRWLGSGLAFAAVVLTRPEGIAVFGAAWIGVAVLAARRRSLRRSLLVNSLIVGGVVVLHIGFRISLYDGAWLPNTFYAKAGGFESIDAWRYVNMGLLSPVFGVIGAGAGVAGLVYRERPVEIVPLGMVAVFAALFPFITGTDWMLGWRLVVPFLPVVAALVVIGWGLLVKCLLPTGFTRSWLPMVLLPVGLLTVWLTEQPTRETLRVLLKAWSTGYRSGHMALADWLGKRAREGDTVALMDIGIIGFRCADQRILDITGLTNRFIAQSPGEFLDKQYDPQYVLKQRPAFIVLTLTHPGNPLRAPPSGTRFGFWIAAEERLHQHRDFKRHYLRRRPPPRTGWIADLAAQVGAEEIFLHLYPGKYYLLAVFRRQDEAPG